MEHKEKIYRSKIQFEIRRVKLKRLYKEVSFNGALSEYFLNTSLLF